MVSNFGFTNVTDSTKEVVTKKLSLSSLYATTEDESTRCVLSNVTCPIDQPEVITMTSSRIPVVNSTIPNYYPPKVVDGVTYAIKVEELLSLTDVDDPKFRVDLPIVAQLSIRHATNGEITEESVLTVITRLISALFKDDGTSRLPDLMRSALEPKSN